jgi:hypothetical protein
MVVLEELLEFVLHHRPLELEAFDVLRGRLSSDDYKIGVSRDSGSRERR